VVSFFWGRLQDERPRPVAHRDMTRRFITPAPALL